MNGFMEINLVSTRNILLDLPLRRTAHLSEFDRALRRSCTNQVTSRAMYWGYSNDGCAATGDLGPNFCFWQECPLCSVTQIISKVFRWPLVLYLIVQILGYWNQQVYQFKERSWGLLTFANWRSWLMVGHSGWNAIMLTACLCFILVMFWC